VASEGALRGRRSHRFSHGWRRSPASLEDDLKALRTPFVYPLPSLLFCDDSVVMLWPVTSHRVKSDPSGRAALIVAAAGRRPTPCALRLRRRVGGLSSSPAALPPAPPLDVDPLYGTLS
jgi:hypothetical protein